jgi:hypothetical protein
MIFIWFTTQEFLMKRYLRFVAVLMTALAALLVVSGAGAQQQAGANPTGAKFTNATGQISLGDVGASVVTPLTSRAPVTLTHSTDPATVTLLNSVSCNAGGLHTENSYYRVFDLDALGVTGAISVNSVDIGVEQAVGAAGTQPVNVKLYTSTIDPPTLASMTLLNDTQFEFADASGVVSNFDVTDTVVPAGSILVVELLTPEGQTAGHSFFIGSNAAGQTDESYLRAPDCGISEPTSTATIGFPNMQIVLVVNADDEVAATETPAETATATATEPPVETATATPTEAPTEVELVDNGGFEADLTPWVLKNASGDKVKCNTETKVVANTGLCAFQFKGVVGESSKIQQTVDLVGVTFTATDTLSLSLFANAKKATASGKVKVVVKYSDSEDRTKLTADIATTVGYAELTDSDVLLSAAVSKIKLQISHKSTSGKIYVDDVSLAQVAASALLPLP